MKVKEESEKWGHKESDTTGWLNNNPALSFLHHHLAINIEWKNSILLAETITESDQGGPSCALGAEVERPWAPGGSAGAARPGLPSLWTRGKSESLSVSFGLNAWETLSLCCDFQSGPPGLSSSWGFIRHASSSPASELLVLLASSWLWAVWGAPSKFFFCLSQLELFSVA